MYLQKGEYVNAFFLIKECKVKIDEETARQSIVLKVISDVGKNTHMVIVTGYKNFEKVCIMGSLIQIVGKVDEERRIIAEQVLPVCAILPSIPIEVDVDISSEEIISSLKSMLNGFDYCPLAEVLLPIIKYYETDLLSLKKTCKLRGVECPSELHAAYALIAKFTELTLKHTHLNFEVLFALTLLNILSPMREKLTAFVDELDFLLPVHSAFFNAVMFKEYASSDNFKV